LADGNLVGREGDDFEDEAVDGLLFAGADVVTRAQFLEVG
jgi:hypothetical protein